MAREETSRRAAEREGGPRPMRAWALLVPERGVPLNFKHFAFQEAWYSEEVANAREVVWEKASQVGMSAYAWRWGARRIEAYGDRGIYFFPTDDDVVEFGRTRIDASIADSEFLRSRIPPGGTMNVHLKQLGDGDISLRGTQSKAAVQSVDADFIVFDEYDLLNPANLEQAERRVAGAQAAGRVPRIRRFGNPTVSGAGIDLYFHRSDQRVWHVRCAACGEEQPLEWSSMRWVSEEGGPECREGADDYGDPGDVLKAWRACRACDASLEPPAGEEFGPIHHGRYVPMNPGARVIGFHVSRLIVPRTDLLELVRNSRKTAAHELEAFHNNDLGVPYSPTEAALTDDDLNAAMSDPDAIDMVSSYRARYPILLGVDVASERQWTAWVDELLPDGRTRCLWTGPPDDFAPAVVNGKSPESPGAAGVMVMMRVFRVSMAVIDSMPERAKARGIQQEFPGRVFLAEYDDRNESDAFVFNPKKASVRVNRTEVFDAMMDSIRRLRRVLPRTEPRRFRAQMKAPKRRTIEEVGKKPKRVYVKTGTEGDDFAHAANYVLVAKEMWALREQVQDAQAAQRAQEPVPPVPLRGRPIDEYVPGLGGVG